MDDLDDASNYNGISYGLENPADRTFTSWKGSFVTITGHTIDFIFKCDNTFPMQPPKLHFDNKYLTIDEDDDEELMYYVKRLRPLLISKTDATLHPSSLPIKNWTVNKPLGEFLTEIRNIVVPS